ncbi:MAG: ABC transporter ATP-binding protein [Acidobacteria bacterium]|nr:ABC transporter ATP-binding protein [Acidobacteriota bacterium]MCA1642841.1 ABC transporter ATP-binding protein [Acidobacteriota bacterium]
MLKIDGLEKTYRGGVRALRGVSLEVAPGMFGLLGPNGAGKTTLMKVLATLLDADAGAVSMGGVDFIAEKARARRMLGYLPQEFGLYPTLTAEQTLDYFARLKGVVEAKERRALVDALIDRVNLSSARAQRVGGFSGGMRQRLGIAQALIGQPELIIVDEPTAGLDPEERLRFHNLLADAAGESAVVILSTHIVSDVSNLCSRMAIIRRGEILAASTPRRATDDLAGSVWEALVEPERIAALKSHLQVISSQRFDGRTRVRVISKDVRPGEEFTSATPTLEDYYFSVVSRAEGREAR